MSFDLLNPWMLAGLAGIALPVLAHLLSRKRYDILEWGAMQFLELDPNARRKLRLEDLLLLLVRIGLIALVTFALARPWISGAWLGRFGSHKPRDIAIVLDRSDSMLWQGPQGTMDRAARDFLGEILSRLVPGDTVALFEAGDQPRLVIGPTRDIRRLTEQLDAMPPPAGSSRLAAGALAAARLLSRTTNLERELVIVSDRQARAWQPSDTIAWQRLDEFRSLATVPIRIWAADVSPPDFGHGENIMVDRLKLSRESTVADTPVRVTTTLSRSGGAGGPRMCKVYLHLDDVRQDDQTLQVRLPAQGQTNVEFEPRFTAPGSHLISIVVDADVLPADDRSDAVVVVRDGLPALLVDGEPSDDPTRSETFFAEAALASGDQGSSWVRANVQTVAETNFAELSPYAVIVLANIATLEDESVRMLVERVKSAGTAVLITAGTRLEPETSRTWFAGGQGWLPCRVDSILEDKVAELKGVHVSNDSLELPWLNVFRTERGGSLTEARFAKWWKLAWDDAQPPVIVSRLTTGDPWLVTRKHGRGTVAMLTSTLDADWNTLPANADYVPWLHELLFFLASSEASRNVEPGQPLVLNLAADVAIEDVTARDPLGKEIPVDRGGDEIQRTAIVSEATRPGVYRLEVPAGDARRTAFFAVQPDRAESDLTPLTDGDRAQLTAGDRLTFITSADELQRRMRADSSRAELWWLILYAFLAMLVWETWLTRRLVRGGKVVIEDFPNGQ